MLIPTEPVKSKKKVIPAKAASASKGKKKGTDDEAFSAASGTESKSRFLSAGVLVR
jgi:hypothetical protein